MIEIEILLNIFTTEGIDPNGYCFEMYSSEKDVRCMVKLKSN
jgi:hypothetical protein